MRREMGRGVLKSFISLGITVECYYTTNPNLTREYIVYLPKKYSKKFSEIGIDCFDSDPVGRYHTNDPAHRSFLELSLKYGIKSPDYAGFYLYGSDFDKYVGPITPPVLQGDSL